MNLRLIGKRHILVLCLLAWVIPVKADGGIYENALVLYSQGMYQRAKVLFEECPQEPSFDASAEASDRQLRKLSARAASCIRSLTANMPSCSSKGKITLSP